MNKFHQSTSRLPEKGSSSAKNKAKPTAQEIFDNRIERKKSYSTSNKNTDQIYKTDTSPEWLDLEHAAAYLCIAEGTLRNLTSNGKVTHYKFGRRVLYRKEDLRNLPKRQGGFDGN